jgi:fructose-1,6-bisphosphatase/inositol monophosphatase family enzyme
MQSGDSLVGLSGRIQDIGISKKYLTEKDLEIERGFAKLIDSLPGKHSLYGEEEHSSLEKAQSLWVIDPISRPVA